MHQNYIINLFPFFNELSYLFESSLKDKHKLSLH